MRSNSGMANRQGDVDLRFAQVSAPQLELWLGLAWQCAIFGARAGAAGSEGEGRERALRRDLLHRGRRADVWVLCCAARGRRDDM
jgi:hypothetical protein